MDKLMQSFTKIRLVLLLFLFTSVCLNLLAQRDCAEFEKRTKERSACELGLEAIKFKQGSRQSQLLFDMAIKLNPNYAWAYYEKSVPYLKRGMLGEGFKILNKAVELDPLSYLTYRAYWYFQHKSYAQCIQDLERYYALDGAYMKSTPGGALDMRMVLGITHAQLGNNQKAIDYVTEVIEGYETKDNVGPYDYHTLGVLYWRNGDLKAAIEALNSSIERNEQFADTYYYLAIVSEEMGDIRLANTYINESILRFDGKKPGYSGYPFCFPISVETALAKRKVLMAL